MAYQYDVQFPQQRRTKSHEPSSREERGLQLKLPQKNVAKPPDFKLSNMDDVYDFQRPQQRLTRSHESSPLPDLKLSNMDDDYFQFPQERGTRSHGARSHGASSNNGVRDERELRRQLRQPIVAKLPDLKTSKMDEVYDFPALLRSCSSKTMRGRKCPSLNPTDACRDYCLSEVPKRKLAGDSVIPQWLYDSLNVHLNSPGVIADKLVEAYKGRPEESKHLLSAGIIALVHKNVPLFTLASDVLKPIESGPKLASEQWTYVGKLQELRLAQAMEGERWNITADAVYLALLIWLKQSPQNSLFVYHDVKKPFPAGLEHRGIAPIRIHPEEDISYYPRITSQSLEKHIRDLPQEFLQGAIYGQESV